MRKSTKAALLSAFVFPGVGHFFLRRPVPGALLTGAALASLFFLISKMLERALQITAQIQRGEGPLDISAISDLVAKQPPGTESQLVDIASTVLIVSWLIGIVDSYRIGRAQSQADAASD